MVRLPIHQRLGGHQEARRTDAALQRPELEELLLQRMQVIALRHALDGGDPAALGLGRQHQAGADQAVVDGDGAGAAIAGAATFLAAGQSERPAQHVEQALVGVAEELLRLAVDRGGNV